jgi:NAD(P)-dependent dehydrogenase (short-subunit alcohol dehydrogenase family)
MRGKEPGSLWPADERPKGKKPCGSSRLKPEFRAQMDALHPIGRIGKPEDMAEAAIWLSSSKSSFVTGHSLLVDGGYTAQ